MSRNNIALLLATSNFKATAHITLKTLEDLLRNAMLQDIIPTAIKSEPDAKEEFTLSINPLTITFQPLEDIEVIPLPDITLTDKDGKEIKDDNDNLVKLQDPIYPFDRQPQDIFFEMKSVFHLNTNNELLALFKDDNDNGITDIEGELTLLVRPYFSSSQGIGFERYDFKVDARSTSPNSLSDPSVLNDILVNAFYPQIIDLFKIARFVLPDVKDLPIQAIKVFGNFDTEFPATLSIGLGGTGTVDELMPILNAADGLSMTVSATLFNEQIALFNEELSKRNKLFKLGTFNHEELRWERTNFLGLKLEQGQIRLNTEIEVTNSFNSSPDATVSIKGPLTFRIIPGTNQSLLVADGSDLKADVDVSFGWDLLHGFADLITLGVAELFITPAMLTAESNASDGAAIEIAKQLQQALLGNFPSHKEFFGKDKEFDRESAVIIGLPDTILITPTGIMIGGPAKGGILKQSRALSVTEVYRKNKTIKAYGFGFNRDKDTDKPTANKTRDFKEGFYLTKDRVIELWNQDKLRISGLQKVNMKDGREYLRDIADNSKQDNLLKKPFFNPQTTLLANANAQEPLVNTIVGFYDASNVLVEIPI